MDNFSDAAAKKIDGLLYYSESEYPYSIEQWNIPFEELLNKIASENNVAPDVLKTIPAADFFNGVAAAADPNDPPVAANAQKTMELFDLLQSALTNLRVVRVEEGAKIPIYIAGETPGKELYIFKTISIES